MDFDEDKDKALAEVVKFYRKSDNQPLFTLTAEEASLLRYALGDAILYNEKEGSSNGFIKRYDEMFDKITKWLYDNEI